jgi:hypothetical protein
MEEGSRLSNRRLVQAVRMPFGRKLTSSRNNFNFTNRAKILDWRSKIQQLKSYSRQ